MSITWYQRNDAAVIGALRRGQRPDMATTMASGPLDELVALHDELGVFEALDAVLCQRQRRGVDDKLLLRTAAVLPFIESSALSGAAGQLFGEPAILLHLGWSPLQISIGDNERHRHPEGRRESSLPCHPDTLRDALRRVSQSSWQRVQETGVKALYARGLVRGHIYAIDGTGLEDGLRLVCLVCVSAERPVVVAWRILTGDASEKGQEAAVTRSLIEQAPGVGWRRLHRVAAGRCPVRRRSLVGVAQISPRHRRVGAHSHGSRLAPRSAGLGPRGPAALSPAQLRARDFRA